MEPPLESVFPNYEIEWPVSLSTLDLADFCACCFVLPSHSQALKKMLLRWHPDKVRPMNC